MQVWGWIGCDLSQRRQCRSEQCNGGVGLDWISFESTMRSVSNEVRRDRGGERNGFKARMTSSEDIERA